MRQRDLNVHRSLITRPFERPAYGHPASQLLYRVSEHDFGKLVRHIDLRQFSYRTLSRKAWINRPISGASSSSAKCPVSSRCNSVFGSSRRNASAPGAEKIGSFLPHTASTGGCLSRRY